MQTFFKLFLITALLIACEKKLDTDSGGTPANDPPSDLSTGIPEVQNLRISKFTTDSLVVSWDLPLEGFKGKYRVSSGSQVPNDCFNYAGETTTLSYEIDNLTADTIYSIRVCSVVSQLNGGTEVNRFSSGNTITGPTLADNPSEVGTLTLVQPTAGIATINVSWTAPQNAKSYLVSAGPSSNAPSVRCESGTVASTAQTNYSFPNLSLNKQYSVRVCAVNGNAASKITDGRIGSIIVKDTPPPNPSNVSISNLTTNSARINWTSGGDNTAAFRIALKNDGTSPNDCNDGAVSNINSPSSSFHDFANLTYLYINRRATHQYRLCAVSSGTNALFSSGVTGSFGLKLPNNYNISCYADPVALFSTYGTLHTVTLTVPNSSDANLVHKNALNSSGFPPESLDQSFGFCRTYSGGICYGGYPDHGVNFNVQVVSQDDQGYFTQTSTYAFRSPWSNGTSIFPGTCSVTSP